jgi:hypothetical protein
VNPADAQAPIGSNPSGATEAANAPETPKGLASKAGPFAAPFGLPAEIIRASYQVALIAEIDAEIEEHEFGVVERRLLCYVKLRANWKGREWALIPQEDARTALAEYLGMHWKNVKPILDRLVFDHVLKVDAPDDGRLFIKIEPPDTWTRPRRRSVEEGTKWLGEAVTAPDLASQPVLSIPVMLTPEKKVSRPDPYPAGGNWGSDPVFSVTPKKKVPPIAVQLSQPQQQSFQSCTGGRDWRATKARMLELATRRADWTRPMREELWGILHGLFDGGFSCGNANYEPYWRKAVRRIPDIVSEVIVILIGEKMDTTIPHRLTNSVAYAMMVQRGYPKIP